ncbi:MAG: proprotein convertase P-domain-containing protein [Deltaproteobacteria bacterium]|nr:proprotein convertase P-domain-containing protein [Deltaproteobacteria bacterium]MBK8716651.1 proprotein convertase P-domain-containing protein [Deltaproteobacteria bacterium]MBP7290170.1 proprotein convertase P-domain-containing protein [Nannocystaceae bacterium]
MMLRRLLRLPLALALFTACDAADDDAAIDADAPLSSYDALFEGAPIGKDLPFELKADGPAPLHHDELVELQSPVKSQGRRGVCSIFATTALMEHLYIKAGVDEPDFSEQYLQWSTKFELGAFKNTSGSNNTFNLDAITRFGIPEESAWPYEIAQWDGTNDAACAAGGENLPTRCYTNGEPPTEAREAEKFHLPKSRFVSTRRAAIMDHIRVNGTAVAIGLDFFYQSWNHRKSTLPVNSDNWDRGIVLFPNDADVTASHLQRAGHAVLIVGWDSELEVPRRDEHGELVRDDDGNPVVEKGFYIIKNSWGTAGFGIDNPHGAGYGFLSMDYVEEYGNARVSDVPVVTPDAPEPGEAEQFASTRSIAIPDNDTTGISDTIEVGSMGVVERVSVGVDISHGFRGDLVVALRKGERRVVLSNKQGGGQKDLVQTFVLETELDGIDRAGAWTLEVADTARADEGTLRGWTIAIQ